MHPTRRTTISDRRKHTPVRILELDASDRHHLLDLLEGLSREDRYWRFFTPLAKYPTALIDKLSAVDGFNHIALGAFDGRRCVGIGRCIRHREAPDTAEVAVTVAHDWRRRGVARRLIQGLAPLAMAQRIAVFDLLVQPTNVAGATLARSLGFSLVFDGDLLGGTVDVRDLAHGVERNAA